MIASIARRCRWLWIAGLVASTAHADPLGAKRAHATRTSSAITIDGRLDEPAWLAAPRSSEFVQRAPHDGGKPTFETWFAVLYDDAAVYVGIWADDADPAQLRRILVRRDVDTSSDSLAVGIDSYHDRRTAFMFAVTAAGVQRDSVVFDDKNVNDEWDAVWTGETSIGEHGWSVELRIPLSQLRFTGDIDEWGIQILRFIGRLNEVSSWSPWPRTGNQLVSKFGVLDIGDLRPARRLELMPYVSGGLAVEPVVAGDPLNDRLDGRANAGFDLKYGVGPAFTLSATANPDFSQIEADPSQINLGPTELQFAEKRPFFLEGMELFQLPLGNPDRSTDAVFYSRRIGAMTAAPAVPYRYLRQPAATRIYGAAKLTGKQAGWSVGVLDAVTANQDTELVDPSGARVMATVAPLTNFAAAHVKRDLRDGATVVGLSATAVNRALAGTPLAANGHDQAYTGGTELLHRWDHDAWELDARVLGSWVHGTPSAVALTQRSTLHLFQRPDASDVTYDPTRTSLSGLAASMLLGRIGATEHWRVGGGGDLRTPGLEMNDLGFQTSADRLIPFAYTQYHDNEPGGHILNWDASGLVYAASTFESRLVTSGVDATTRFLLASYWTVSAGATFARDRWDPVALRGGPALRTDPSGSAWASMRTDDRERVWGTALVRGSRGWNGNRTVGSELGVTVQARPNIDLYLGTSVAVRRDPIQYVAQAQDDAGVSHYVLARIHQVTAALTTRVNWTFSPHLTLQLYAQPFVSAGTYSELKDVEAPHAARFDDRFHVLSGSEYQDMGDTVYVSYLGSYSFAKPDFDLRQLRSNVVVRWEYRPGSTVFATWTHAQTSQVGDGRFQLATDVPALLHTRAENIVMLKANYWLDL